MQGQDEGRLVGWAERSEPHHKFFADFVRTVPLSLRERVGVRGARRRFGPSTLSLGETSPHPRAPTAGWSLPVGEGDPSARRGVTLIELLVVAVIILMMMALAARQMRVSMDSRRAREAARAINVYLSSARNQAIATRKYCGVALMPMMNVAANTTTALSGTTVAPCVATLQQLEVPSPYCGDYASATLLVSNVLGGLQVTNPAGGTPISPGLVHVGDRIQFNSQGPWYYIASSGSDGAPPYALNPLVQTPGQIAPWPAPPASGSATFRIQRMPNLSYGASGGTAANSLIGSERRPAATPRRIGNRFDRLVVQRHCRVDVLSWQHDR